MDDGLKKRLLGATVLVALAVIFVPMLFEKEPEDASDLRESNIPLPPEDRFSSRVLPLESEDLSRPPAQITPLNQIGDKSSKPRNSSSKILALKPEKRVEPEPPIASVAPERSPQPEAPAESVVPESSSHPEPSVVTVVPESASQPELPVKEDTATKLETPPEKKVSVPSWVVQVGSFSNRINADKIADKLKTKGYPAFIEKADISGNSVYRVRVGPERDKSKAEQMLVRLDSELETHKLKGSLKRYP